MKLLILSIVALGFASGAALAGNSSCQDCCKGKCEECCKGNCDTCCKGEKKSCCSK